MKNQYDICFALCAHGRADLLEMVLTNLQIKLKNTNLNSGILVVCSPDDECFDVALDHEVHIHSMENVTLGWRFNEMLMQAAKLGRYVVHIGSDDFLSIEYLEFLSKVAKHENIMAGGLDRAMFIDIESLECREVLEYGSTWMGGGKFIHCSVINKMNGDIYPDHLSRGVDRPAQNKIEKFLISQRQSFIQVKQLSTPGLIALKDGENIHGISAFRNFPEREYQYIYLDAPDREMINLMHAQRKEESND